MKILSVAHAVPSRRVTNEELLERFAVRNRQRLSAEQVVLLTEYLKSRLENAGAVARYHRDETESALELGLAAASCALARASLHPNDIDLLIYTGVGRGFVEPATANVFQAAAALTRATCFDVLDACASWLRGVDVASSLIRTGRYRVAMILNCECNFREYEPANVSSSADLEELWTGYTVGEAATATIVTDSMEAPPAYTTFRNLGRHLSLCQIPMAQADQFLNGTARPDRSPLLFYADPEPLAVNVIKELRKQFWADPELPTQSYDVIFGHSASVPLSLSVLRALRLDASRHYEVFPEYGNTVSAGLPLAMSLAGERGFLKRGQRVLLIMGGAGITTGFSTFVY